MIMNSRYCELLFLNEWASFHPPFPQKGVLETVLGGMGRRSGE
jgi:hypothetical protein